MVTASHNERIQRLQSIYGEDGGQMPPEQTLL